MTDFIKDRKEFELCKSKVDKLFINYSSFEKNAFNEDFRYFLGFDFDYIFEEIFFEGITNFLNHIRCKDLFFYTIEPSPESYFFVHFNKYSVFKLKIDNSYEDFNNIMYKNPGNMADAIGINSNEIAIFSESEDWTILSSREWEIGVVGFKSLQIKEKFLYSFGESADIFTSVEEQVDILDEMLKFDEKIKGEYLELALSYKDR